MKRLNQFRRPLLSLLLLLLSAKVFAAGYGIDTLRIFSAKLNENRTIYVFKPANLNTTDSVTFLYLTDGEFAAGRYDQVQKAFPGTPVIGIGIVNTNRNRDLLPVKQPGNFLGFISSKLMPQVEKGFKVKSRILFGHSFGGGFTIYTLLNAPGLFDKYIASSPTPIMDFVGAEFFLQADEKLQKKIRLYFSYGSNDMKQVKKWAARLNENLSELKLKNIDWECAVFQDKDHNNADLVSVIEGMKF